jgi:hypothetical protein
LDQGELLDSEEFEKAKEIFTGGEENLIKDKK